MSNFDDTDLLYRGPGGEERKLIAEANRLEQYLLALIDQTPDYNAALERLYYLAHKANERYHRRYGKYYRRVNM